MRTSILCDRRLPRARAVRYRGFRQRSGDPHTRKRGLVRQKDLDLANLAELSQYIVQHLRESLLVVDAADRIRLINESAAEILGDVDAVPGALLGEVSPRLLYTLTTWRQAALRRRICHRVSWLPTGRG